MNFDQSQMQTQMMQQFPGFVGNAQQAFQPAPAPVVQSEPTGWAEIKKFLTRLAEGYIFGELIQPTVNKKKAGAYGKTQPKRSGIQKRIEVEQSKINNGVLSYGQNWFVQPFHFTLLNMVGSAAILSEYLSTRLSADTSNFSVDCGQIACAAMLQCLISNPSTYLSKDNINIDSNVTVFKFFEDYRLISDESEDSAALLSAFSERLRLHEAQLASECARTGRPYQPPATMSTPALVAAYRKSLVESFFDSFVMGVYKRCVEVVIKYASVSVNNYGGVGQYNFSSQVRDSIRSHVMSSMFSNIAQEVDVLVRDSLQTMTVSISRKNYFGAKFEVKVKDESNIVSLLKLVPLMKELGIIENVSVGLPSWTRKEAQNGVIFYGNLPLDQNDAYKLGHAFGVNWKASKLIKDVETVDGTNGKRKTKVLSNDGARDKLVKLFSKHFDSQGGKPPNKDALVIHRKYIDITNAKPKMGTGLQISPSDGHVVLPYVNEPVDIRSFSTSGQFEALNNVDKLKIILSHIGYAHGKMDQSQVRNVIEDLHTVFGIPFENKVLNTLPTRGQNTGSIFGANVHAQQMNFGSPMYFQQMQPQAPQQWNGQMQMQPQAQPQWNGQVQPQWNGQGQGQNDNGNSEI